MKQLVFFASGSGTNFQAVIDAINHGNIDATITGLITNKPNIGAVNRAQKNQIPVEILAPASFSDQKIYEEQLLQVLQNWHPHLIVLAGYLLKIPASIIKAYPNQIINIHPSLLPEYGGEGFYGMKVHQAVIKAQELETGCSVHLVNEEYDKGPVLAQRKVKVKPEDTAENLANRVLKQEHRLLPETIKNYLTNYN